MDKYCSYKNFLVNGNFALPNIQKNSHKYYNGDQVPGWKFNGAAIIDRSNDWGYPIPYPCGVQACSIRRKMSISQTFSVPVAGKYILVILYVGRPRGANNLNIILNNNKIKSIVNPPIDKWNQEIVELNITNPQNNKLEIKGTYVNEDRSTAIQLILTFADCPKDFPYVAYNGKICYTDKRYADRGSGPCESWCTNDPKFGSGCGDPSLKMCSNKPITTQPLVDFNYDVNSVPVYEIGNYGIKPWGKNNTFPDQTANWIWYSQFANSNAPDNRNTPMNIQYVYTNKNNSIQNANLNVIIDNSCEVFLNSKLLKKISGGWGQGNNRWNIISCKIPPGKNLFEFKVVNLGGPAGLLVSAISTSVIITDINVGEGEFTNNNILFNTNKNWKFVPINIEPVTTSNLSQPGLISTIDNSFPWGALTLNGTSSQYVDIGKTTTGMKGLSFGCWFRSDSNKNFARIFDFGNGAPNNNIILYIHGGKIGFTIYLMNKRTHKINLSPNINDNKWNHLVLTVKPNQKLGSQCVLYLNNNQVSSFEYIYPTNVERANCYIGKSNWTIDPYFSGAISNFVMYQKVLSVKEVNALYMSMINLNDPALYIYLPFSTNSVLDTLLANYAGKTFSLPIIKSEVKNENWNCVEEEKNKWISVKMENNKPICMSMDGANCIEEENQKACETRITNPVVPSNPIICGGSKMNLGWCEMAKKQLTQSDNSNLLEPSAEVELEGTQITDIRPELTALSALQTNTEGELLNLKPLEGGGQILSLTNMNDVDNLMIGGTFKLRVNLPTMPPYIIGKSFDINKGTNPNFFYLCIEKLDNNCNIKSPNGRCIRAFADNKKCNNTALTNLNRSNTYRLVLVSSQYVLDSSIPIGKNSDFTIVKVNNQMYLKNIQTGYLPSLYSDNITVPVYGDIEIKSNSNANKIYSKLNNTECNKEAPPVQTTGTTFVKCDIKRNPGTFLITSKNIGSSSPIRVNINPDKTISLNLLSFNTYGNPTDIYTLTSCNFNVQTFAYIEKITNNIATFLINMVCFEPTQNSKSNSKNQLKFTVELINFPDNFVRNNSIFNVN